VLGIGRAFLDRHEAGLRPRADRMLVPEVRVDGHFGPTRGDERLRQRPGGTRPEASSARGRHEEHVQPASPRHAVLPPRLEVAHRLAVCLHDPCVDRLAGQPSDDLVARKGLAVPEARDLGVGMPGDEQVGIGLSGAAHVRQLAAQPGHERQPNGFLQTAKIS
jgi:hypothetical protein